MKQFDELMNMVIKPTGNAPIYNCLLSVNSGSGKMNYSGAAGVFHEGRETISSTCLFRTGSITKPFTAAIVLQLVEEGLFCIEDLFFDLVGEDIKKELYRLHWFEGADWSGAISVLHLLQHRSGLRDYFADDERFLHYVMQHPSQNWNWRLVMEKYFEYGLHQKVFCRPGGEFYYSDTNYLLLGVLIEQITGKRLQQVYDEHIIVPLGLKETYLEFFQAPAETGIIVFPHYGSVYLENVHTSFDWGGGGLVSTMKDLHVFIRSLVSGCLFKYEETLGVLLSFGPVDTGIGNSKRTVRYGMGIQQREYPSYTFLGHSSAYASMVYYDRNKDLSIVLSLNQAAAVHKAEWLMNKIIKLAL